MEKHHRVTFLPEKKTVKVEHLKTLFETIQDQNIENIQLRFACGAEGICQKCKIKAFHKMGPLTPTEKGCLSEDELVKGVRLACQARVIQDMHAEILYKMPFTIEITEEVLTDAAGLQPRIRKIYIPAGNGGSLAPGLVAVALRAEGLKADEPEALAPEITRQFGAFFQRARRDCTAVLIENELVCLEEGDTRQQQYAAAVDLGTNTLMVSLVDISAGTRIAVATDTNPQLPMGATFESRIHRVSEDPIYLELLNEELLLRIDILIGELCRAKKISPAHVYEIVVSGSTGMLHLFLKGAPGLLEQRPGEEAAPRSALRAQDLELKSSQHARVYALPVISPYVGADVTAGILATRLHRCPETVLLVDFGTTIKAVLHHRGRILAVGMSGGQAFEGAGIRFGMRPEAGAIEGVLVTDDLHLSVIGESLPRGICGSGLIDLVAGLKRTGILDQAGNILDPGRLQLKPPRLRDRIISAGAQPAILVHADTGEFQSTIYITQDDIFQLGRSKACLTALLTHLTGHANIGCEQVERVLISGACGRRISISALVELGLIPSVLESRTLFVGNTAKKGAQMALLDKRILDEAERLTRLVECLPPPRIEEMPVSVDFVCFP